MQTQAHVFFDVVGGDMITVHRFPNEISIFDDNLRAPFDEAAEPMPAKGHQREKSMEKHQNQSATERGEKCRAAVDHERALMPE